MAVRTILVLLLVALVGSAHAETFRDPQGRFSFDVPNGWRVSSLGAQGANASDGNAFVSVVNVQGGGADPKRIRAVTDQIGAQWQSFKQGETGVATVAGQNGFYVFFDGVNPKGVASTMRVVGAAFGADAFMLIMAAPAADFGKSTDAFKLIEHSFAVAANAAPAAPPPPGEAFRDPQGRFSFGVPPGWTVAALGAQGATASAGDAYVSVVEVPGGGTDTGRITALITQIGAQWQSFKQGESGIATLAGQNGFYVFFDGVNPKGVTSTMRIVGANFRGDEYLLIMSAPATDFGKMAGPFKLIEHSFAVAAGAAPGPAPASAGALPARPAPQGLQTLDEPGGGRIVFGPLGAASSGQEAFRAGIQRFRGYFDASPELRNGVDSKDGNLSMVLFSAALKGTPVMGLAVATSDAAGGARIGFLFDAADRFAQTLAPMQRHLRQLTLAALEGARPAAASASGGLDLARIAEAAKSVPLTDVRSLDQTETVGVAQGFQIQRMELGSFSATGSDGALVVSGGGFALIDPSGGLYQSWKRLMAMTPNYHADYPGLLIPYIADPAEAWVAARRLSAQQQKQPDPQITLATKTPLQIPPGPVPMTGALIQGTEMVNATPMVFLGTVIAGRPSPEGSWTITVNLLHAPADHAAADLPPMWAMIQSLRIDPQKLSAATSAISQTMFEQSNRIMQERHEANMDLMQTRFEHSMAQARSAQDAIDKSAAATIRHLRDESVVVYAPTGEHVAVTEGWASELARDDPQNFSVIPLKEYVKGIDY